MPVSLLVALSLVASVVIVTETEAFATGTAGAEVVSDGFVGACGEVFDDPGSYTFGLDGCDVRAGDLLMVAVVNSAISSAGWCTGPGAQGSHDVPGATQVYTSFRNFGVFDGSCRGTKASIYSVVAGSAAQQIGYEAGPTAYGGRIDVLVVRGYTSVDAVASAGTFSSGEVMVGPLPGAQLLVAMTGQSHTGAASVPTVQDGRAPLYVSPRPSSRPQNHAVWTTAGASETVTVAAGRLVAVQLRFGGGSTVAIDEGQSVCTSVNEAIDARSGNADCIADPVNTATGAYEEHVVDLSMPGVGLDFELARSYASNDASVGPMGRGWSHTYAASLTVRPDGDVVLDTGRGQQIVYDAGPGGSFGVRPGVRSTLEAVGDGYRLTRTDRSVLGFDHDGQLVSIVDRSGNAVSLEHGSGGQLEQVTDTVGRVVTFTSDGDGRVTSATLPDGRSVTYGYTGELLTAVTDPTGAMTTYAYDADGRMSSKTDANGDVVFVNAYGAGGRVVSQLDPLGNETTFGWDVASSTSTVTDPAGGVHEAVYSGNVLLRTTDPLGNTVVYGYDDDANQTTVTDARGHTTTSSYDQHGNLLSLTAPAPLSYEQTYSYNADNDLIEHVDGRGGTTTFVYDQAGNPIEIERPGGDTVTFVYDGRGLMTATTGPDGATWHTGYDLHGNPVSVTSPTGTTTTRSFDQTGRLIAQADPRGNEPGAELAPFTTSYGYDAADRLTHTTDPLGATTTIAYDAGGRITEQSDPLGNVTGFEYNAAGEVTRRIEPGGASSTFEYDDRGDLIAVVSAEGHRTTFTYDLAGRRTALTDPRGHQPGVDPAGYRWTYDHDASGNLVTVTDPHGIQTHSSYDAMNRRTAVIDGLGRTTGYRYDAADNLIEVTDPAGQSTVYDHDPLGRLVSVEDVRGGRTEYGYSLAGARTETIDPAGARTTFGHDDDGRLLWMVDARGNEPGANPDDYRTSFVHDAAGHLTATTDPTGATITTGYDPAGRQVAVTDAGGNTTSYRYDLAGRLEAVTAPDGAATTYTYDERGNLTGRTDGNGNTTSYGYDADQRLIELVDPLGGTWTYGYDAAGNRTVEIDANANASGEGTDGTTTLGYDALDRITSIVYGDDTPGVTYVYDAAGNRTEMTDGDGTVASTYDVLDRPTQISRDGDTFGYLYDAAGNPTGRTYPDGHTIVSTYDPAGRLTAVTTGPHTTSYGYDPAGNLTTAVLPNGLTETRTHDRAGRITSQSWTDGHTPHLELGYTYDPVGNPASAARDGRITSYTYDVRNQLVGACFDASCDDHLDYTYDPVGNRLTEQRPDATTTYRYNAADQLTSIDGPAGTAGYTYDANGNQTSAGDLTFTYDTANRIVRVTAPTTGTGALVELDAGDRHSLALDSDGRVWAWGDNSRGQLADAATSSATSPQLVDGLPPIVSIAAGATHNLALDTDGRVWAWGANSCGQLGDGTTTDRTEPVQIAGLTGVTSIAAGGIELPTILGGGIGRLLTDAAMFGCSGHSLAALEDGTARAWGANGRGQLGNGVFNGANPVPTWVALSGVETVHAGGNHSLAITALGICCELYLWGANDHGQLGDATTTDQHTPLGLTGFDDVAEAEAGANHTLATRLDGTTWAWGDNRSGQLGDGTTTTRTVPTQVSIDPAAQLAAGTDHTLALLDDGTLTSWGTNSSGQLGDGTTTSRNAPAPTPDIDDTELIAAGAQHSLASLPSGAAAFGANHAGQLGDGTTTTRAVPTDVVGLGATTEIVYGYDGDGNRTTTTLDGHDPIRWLWDTAAPLPMLAAEHDHTGTPVRTYTHGHGLLSLHDPAGTYHYHTDRLGSVAAVTDSAASRQWTYVYEPFGAHRTATPTSTAAPTNPMGFTGQPLDATTGLYHLRARDYDPALGRFTATDPLALPVTDPYVSSYLYVTNRPTVLIDPTGLRGIEAAQALAIHLHKYGPALEHRALTGMFGRNPLTKTQIPPAFAHQPSTPDCLFGVHGTGCAYAFTGDILGVNSAYRCFQGGHWTNCADVAIAGAGGGAIRAGAKGIRAAARRFLPTHTAPKGSLDDVFHQLRRRANPDFSDAARAPGAGWEWRGTGPAGSRQGNWHNPRTGESLHPDLGHPGPLGPHYDYRSPDGSWYRMFADGRIELK